VIGRRLRQAGRATRGSALIVGSYVTAVHAARSLAGAGFRVIVSHGPEYSTAHYSRACHEVFRHPPLTEKDAYLDALLGLIRATPDLEVILPLRPNYVACLAADRSRLPERPLIAMPDPSVVLTCLDKDTVLAMAARLGVPVRRSLIVHDVGQLEEAAQAVGFPCLVKPASDQFGPLPGRRKAIRCDDLRSLRTALPSWPTGHRTLIVQPWVSGPRYNIDFVARNGRLLMAAHAYASRTDRLDGTGSGVEILLTDPRPQLVEATERLLGELDYTGPGGIQFMVPERGEPHLLEVNPRVAMPAAIWAAFGFDPVLAACQLAGVDVGWREDPSHSIAPGTRGVWTTRDLYGLLTTIARGEIGPRRAASWLATSVRVAVTADAHMTWSWRDPLPTLVATGNVLWPGTWLASRKAARATDAGPGR
jgi:biotin carboxylase